MMEPSSEPEMQGKIHEFLYRGVNVKFFVENEHDVVQNFHSKNSFYEVETLERLRHVIPRDAIILDCGANVGNHTVFFSMFCAPSRILAFEPNAYINRILNRNIQINSIDPRMVECIPHALGSSAFEADIVVNDKNNWGNGHLKAIDASNNLAAYSQRVSVITIDSIELNTVDFVKIDVEGHEVGVIQGAYETFRHSRPVLFIEIGSSRLKAVHELLDPLGYGVIDYVTQYRGQLNLLYVPIK